MPIYANDNGTLRKVTGIYVNDNGTLRTIDSADSNDAAVYVNDNGTLRTVYTREVRLNDPTEASALSAPGGSQTTVELDNTGQVNITAQGDFGGSSGDHAWLLFGAASDYEARLTGTGDALTGDVEDTWLSLGTTRSWGFSTSGTDTKTYAGTLEIRDATTTDVLTSVEFTLDCSSEGGA